MKAPNEEFTLITGAVVWSSKAFYFDFASCNTLPERLPRT
jgi:hypothetical protein